jgi:hypothetical protein
LPRLAQAAISGQPASPGRTRLRAGAAKVATGAKPVARERAATPFSRLRLSMAKSSYLEYLVDLLFLVLSFEPPWAMRHRSGKRFRP